ncbi:YidC/Oxa1 family membrane protein insertase [Euzebya tangerina]|uniref:YidC/Oxa1 family membrane protein insertase n=1 Tax=Euzebya tangerina TaxID=591198 RepID=UPI000E31C3A9|nr:YidC/Oxa1 family membrane protein insertase [Euzebya tangerina]
MGAIWNGLLDGLEAILRFYEGLLEPLVGQFAWGIAIILLTVTVRIFLIPLMVRQTRSMRGMQQIQPELKKIQAKYKADPGMRKTDPERYQKLKEKQREAQMALYQEHGVNPVGGCLPLLLQMPIFFALFRVLQPAGDDSLRIPELEGAPWLGIESLTNTAQGSFEIGAIALVILQVATTYWSQKQMQARNANDPNSTSNDQQAQVQKIMLYVMPVFLGFLSFTFPIGVVLYWVTTNLWTMGQQALIFRKVAAEEEAAAEARKEEHRRKKRAAAARRKRDVSGKSDQSSDVVKDSKGKNDGKNGSGNGNKNGQAGKSQAQRNQGKKSNSRKSSSNKSSGSPSTGKKSQS